jgi:hypothetical protein
MSTPLGLQLWNGLAILLLSRFLKNPPKAEAEKSLELILSNDTCLRKKRGLSKIHELPHDLHPLHPEVLYNFADYFWHFTGLRPYHCHNNAISGKIICLLIFFFQKHE